MLAFAASLFFVANNYDLGRMRPSDHVVPAETAARNLGSQLGLSVELGRDLRNQPVLLLQRNADPMRLLSVLTFALHGSMVREGSVLRIIRTKKDNDSLRDLDRSLMSQKIDERKHIWDADLKRAAALGSPAAAVAHLIHSDALLLSQKSKIPGTHSGRDIDPALICPAGRLLRGLVDLIPKEELASLLPGSVRVYSDRPTEAESAIKGADDLIIRFTQEQISYASDAALQISPLEVKKSLDGFVMPPLNAEITGVRALLTLKRERNNLLFFLTVFNAKGGLLATSFTWTDPSRDNHLPYQRSALAAYRSKDAIVTLNGEQATFINALEPPYTPIPASDPLFQQILHPEAQDPADLLVRTALGPWIESDDKPIVAVIDDNSVMAARYAAKGRIINTAAFESLLQDASEYQEYQGVRVIRGRDPLSSEPYTCDRGALGSTMRRFMRDGKIDLRGWCVLARNEGLSFEGLPRMYLGLLQNGASLPEFVDPLAVDDIVRLMGAISDEKWRELDQGRTVEASDEQLQVSLYDFFVSTLGKILNAPRLSVIEHFPTELFPSGVPPTARIVVRAVQTFALRQGSDPHHPGAGDMDLSAWTESMHRVILERRRMNMPGTPFGSAALDLLTAKNFALPCERTTYYVDFELSEAIKYSIRFKDPSREVAPAGPFSSLPKPFLDQIYAEWNRLESGQSLSLPPQR